MNWGSLMTQQIRPIPTVAGDGRADSSLGSAPFPLGSAKPSTDPREIKVKNWK